MRLSSDLAANVNVIRGYGRGEIRINDLVYRSTLIVAAASLREEPGVSAVADLNAAAAARMLEFAPELVLVGTGPRQVFPAPSFGALFLQKGIGFEVMDTGAACRTFNVLVGEQRHVVALLMM